MRLHVLAALFLAALSLTGCNSSPEASGPSKGGTQREKEEPKSAPQVDRSRATDTLDALGVEALKKKEGERVSVKGKVYSTHLAQSGKAFTLNLGPNWKTCFKAVVFKHDFEKWNGGTDGMKTAYGGKVVVIEGKIKLYQGSPEIVLNTPSQIELAAEGDK
jgi:hypothetical protein